MHGEQNMHQETIYICIGIGHWQVPKYMLVPQCPLTELRAGWEFESSPRQPGLS